MNNKDTNQISQIEENSSVSETIQRYIRQAK